MSTRSDAAARVDRRLRWLVVGFGLLLAGCGGAAAAMNPGQGTPDAPAPPASAPAVAAAGASEVLSADTVVSPIAEFINGPGDDLTTLREIHEGTARCMQNLGWDYTAPDVTTLDHEKPPSTLGALRVWTTSYGYGITTQPDQGTTIRAAIDAQEAYQEQLDPEAQARYQADLYGPDGSDEGAPIGADRPGCAAQAEHDAYADVPAANGALLDVLAHELGEIWASDEYRAALDEWRSCMQERGFDFTGPGEAKQSVLDRFTAGGVNELRDYERRVATADLTCAESTLLPVTIPLETAAVGQLVVQFPQYAAAANHQ